MGKKTTGRKASGMFNTFWYKIWTESEHTCRGVGKYLGMSGASARSYFIGARIPTREVAEKLCKLFDVDVEKGVEEFNKGYAEYHKSLATTTEVIVPSSGVIPSGTTVTVKDIKVSNPEQEEAFTKALKLLYQKVDFDTYMKVAEVLRG